MNKHSINVTERNFAHYFERTMHSLSARIAAPLLATKRSFCENVILFCNSMVKEQQAGSHHNPEPSYPPDRRGGCLHRLHSYHAVSGHKRNAMHCPVRGDTNLAP